MLDALDLSEVSVRSRECNVAPGHSRCMKKIRGCSCRGGETGECESRRMKQSHPADFQKRSRAFVLEICQLAAHDGQIRVPVGGR